MYSLLEKVDFHCYVSLPEGIFTNQYSVESNKGFFRGLLITIGSVPTLQVLVKKYSRMAPLAAWQSGTLAAADVGKALDEGPFDKVGNITKDFLL